MPTNIIDQLNQFYKKDQAEIKRLLKIFCQKVLFADFPELATMASIVVTGSVSTNSFDKHSDIDLVIIFKTEKQQKKYKPLLMNKYKWGDSEVAQSKIEFHGMNIRFFKQLEEEVTGFKVDWRVFEYAHAMIISDPEKRFVQLMREYLLYPRNILNSKLRWLLQDAQYQLTIRYDGALKRGNKLLCEDVKIRLIKLLGTALVMAASGSSFYCKHLMHSLKPLSSAKEPFYKLILDLLDSNNIVANQKTLQKLFELTEKRLIGSKLIEQDWQTYRASRPPAVSVIFEP